MNFDASSRRMKNQMKNLKFLLLFLAAPALAQELTRPRFEYSVFLGSSFSAKSSFNTTMSGSSSKFHSTSSDSGKPGFSFGVDGTYNFSDQIGATILIDSTQYRYSDSTKPDEMFFIGAGPKLYTPASERVSLWTALAVGIFENRLGSTEETDGASTLRAKNKSSFGFGISPRVGADIKISEGLTIKAMVSFTESKFVHNLESKSSGVVTGSGSAEVTRSFFGAYVGLAGGF